MDLDRGDERRNYGPKAPGMVDQGGGGKERGGRPGDGPPGTRGANKACF